MNAKENKIVKDLYTTIRQADKKGTQAYDTPATVTRIEGETAWVHIPGGVDETPARRTIDAKKGDSVQVRVSGGSAWLVGNASAPPTDDTTAKVAKGAAESAYKYAAIASEKAEDAIYDAGRARAAANRAEQSASDAQDSADEALASAHNANEYAARALGNLSTVQSVVETLNWITAHGTMTLTTDTALDPTHVYFVRDNNGDYEVSSYRYSVVTEPNVDDIGTYYELSIDESLNNYVGTHLAVTGEGLWLIPETLNGNRVLIATGSGTTYTVAGTYIIGADGTALAYFRADGLEVLHGATTIAHLGYGTASDSSGSTGDAPYYILGEPVTTASAHNSSTSYAIGDLCMYDGVLYMAWLPSQGTWSSTKGNFQRCPGKYSLVEGTGNAVSDVNAHAEGVGNRVSGANAHAEGGYNVAGGGFSHAEGSNTKAFGHRSHTEGSGTSASNYYAHAEGLSTKAIGIASHAEGQESHAGGYASHAGCYYTRAESAYQTAIGKFNEEDSAGTYALIIGNGTGETARSNAFAVAWDGGIEIQVTSSEALGQALTAIGWSDLI